MKKKQKRDENLHGNYSLFRMTDIAKKGYKEHEEWWLRAVDDELRKQKSDLIRKISRQKPETFVTQDELKMWNKAIQRIGEIIVKI